MSRSMLCPAHGEAASRAPAMTSKACAIGGAHARAIPGGCNLWRPSGPGPGSSTRDANYVNPRKSGHSRYPRGHPILCSRKAAVPYWLARVLIGKIEVFGEPNMRGRLPVPTERLRLNGGFRADRHGKRADEPLVEGVVGTPPKTLKNAVERAVWREVAEVAYWLTPADRSTLETFCRLKTMERNDFASMAGYHLSALTKLGSVLGLTPTERARLALPGPPMPPDPADRFFDPPSGRA